MIPTKSKRYYPSLIISQEKIQVIRLDDSGQRISHLAEERLDPQVIEAGEVKDTKALARSLTKLMTGAKIDTPQVVVGIPENKCYTKVLMLPKLKSEELAEAVSWEADTYLPVDSESVYMDWKIVDGGQKASTTVLLIAVPKEIIEGYTGALVEAGLTPVAFETTALSLVRMTEKEKRRTLIIEINMEHAVLTLTHGSAIEASSIASFPHEGENTIIEKVTSTAATMLSYYEEKKDKEKIERIYICGERAQEAFRSGLEKGTGREVVFAPLLAQNIPKGQEMSFAVAASLAKTEIQAPTDEYTINLLPPQIQEEFDRVKGKKTNMVLAVVTTTVTAIITIAATAAYLILGHTQSSLQREKASLPALPVETGRIITDTQGVNRAASAVVHAYGLRSFPQGQVAEILANLPEGISVTLVRIDERLGTIQVTGRAVRRADLLTFRDNLDRTQLFSDAILPLASLQHPENIDFTLTANLR